MAHKTAWLACAAAAWLAAAPSTAQTPSAERPAPRTADGKPDLTGIWVATGAILLFEMVQLPDRVIMLYEIHHAFRIIPTDGRPPPEDAEPSYLGESVGRWEGDTLVVDVTSFNDKTWLTGVGTIHTEDLRVTERYTRDSHDTIRYEVTMEDPNVLTRPWTLRETFRLRPNERLREYECIESNEDLLRFERLLQEAPATEAAP